MSNMGYCRNENTLRDLIDVKRNLRNPASESERHALVRIVQECGAILESVGYPLNYEALETAKTVAGNLLTDEEREIGDY